MTDQLQDKAWQQQEPDDEPEYYEGKCEGCGAYMRSTEPLDDDDWYCPLCIGEQP